MISKEMFSNSSWAKKNSGQTATNFDLSAGVVRTGIEPVLPE